MISFRSNKLSLKYTRRTPLGCKYVEIRQFNCVTKTQFLCESEKFPCLRHPTTGILGMKFESLIAGGKITFLPCCRVIKSLNHLTTGKIRRDKFPPNRVK